MKDWTYSKVSDYSSRLTCALSEVLNVEKDKVFVGGEEKMFFYRLKGHLDIGEQFCAECIYDVMHLLKAFEDLSSVDRYKKRWKLSVLGFYYKIKGVKKNESEKALSLLQDNKRVIHFAAHLRREDFVLPNITKLFFSYPPKNRTMRSKFKKSLLENGFDRGEAEFLHNIFPLSHLEAYSVLRSHKMQRENNLSLVCTSVYGVMIDPLLAAMMKGNNTKKVYVQHGGYYGLVNNLAHQIEVEASDEMLWWGVGEDNVFPTRYSLCDSNRASEVVRVVCSLNTTLHDDFFLARIAKIKKNSSCYFEVVGHPRSDKKSTEYDRYGLSDKDHAYSAIVIYDNALHSLLFSRLINKQPFFVVDGFDYQPQHYNAGRFLDLMRYSGIMSDLDTVMWKVGYMMRMSKEQRNKYFRELANPLIEYIYSLPKLNELYDV